MTQQVILTLGKQHWRRTYTVDATGWQLSEGELTTYALWRVFETLPGTLSDAFESEGDMAYIELYHGDETLTVEDTQSQGVAWLRSLMLSSVITTTCACVQVHGPEHQEVSHGKVP